MIYNLLDCSKSPQGFLKDVAICANISCFISSYNIHILKDAASTYVLQQRLCEFIGCCLFCADFENADDKVRHLMFLYFQKGKISRKKFMKKAL